MQLQDNKVQWNDKAQLKSRLDQYLRDNLVSFESAAEEECCLQPRAAAISKPEPNQKQNQKENRKENQKKKTPARRVSAFLKQLTKPEAGATVPSKQAEPTTPPPSFMSAPPAPASAASTTTEASAAAAAAPTAAIDDFLADSFIENGVARQLNLYMYERDITTAMIYSRCFVDRKLISKITNNSKYHPSKPTMLALCIGLRLDLQEGERFLRLAGYSFSNTSRYDLIIKFMLLHEIYDLDVINEMLYQYGQPCFGA